MTTEKKPRGRPKGKNFEFIKSIKLNQKQLDNWDSKKIKAFLDGSLKQKEINNFEVRQEIKTFIEDIALLGNWLLQLNLIAWQYISKKGILQYNERYHKLQNTQIWFLGLNMRERIDKIKGILPKDANMSEYSFHHEPPYRNHWHTLFITGKFVQNHKKGSCN